LEYTGVDDKIISKGILGK